jgi:hypothetical protein
LASSIGALRKRFRNPGSLFSKTDARFMVVKIRRAASTVPAIPHWVANRRRLQTRRRKRICP